MDTFPVVRRKDEENHGEYRSKRVILEIYDEIPNAIHSGIHYDTRLNPQPADPRFCHATRTNALVVTLSPNPVEKLDDPYHTPSVGESS